jgi:hypothetical protein
MLDRTVSMHVRSNGRNASSHTDFKRHLETEQARNKVLRFRLYVSLVGMTRLCIRGVPAFQPDLALAYRMFDYLDDQVIVKEYNLTPPTPRKAMKRTENLITMIVMKAVADVFMYQQSASFFDDGAPTAQGRGQPFEITQLCDVIRQLRATPELIMMAFSHGLDHSVGTSYSGFGVMTALCEHLGLSVGDWLKKPSTSGPSPPAQPSTLPVSSEGMLMANSQSEADRAQQTAQLHANRSNQRNNLYIFSNLVTLEGMSKEERDEVLKSLERSRRSTCAYRLLCSQNGNSDTVMANPIDTIEKVMGGAPRPPDACSDAGSSTTDNDTDYLPFYSSSILAGIAQLNMFYSADNVAAWCSDTPVTSGVDNLSLGTSYGLKFSESHHSGPSQYNYTWLVANGDQGHRGVALSMINRNNTVANFDLGINVLRDTLYLLSTTDNTRRCTERPNLNDMIHERRAFVGADGQEFESTFGLSSKETQKNGGIRIKGAVDFRDRAAREQAPGSMTKPRHPYAKMTDSEMQRKVDFLIQGGRFPATLAFASNKVSKCAPIRIITKGDHKILEANTATCIDHTRTLAESIVRGSLQPGMRGMQESLCGNTSAPPGLCAARSANHARLEDDERTWTLPYSMDIIGISMTLDVVQRLFDGEAETACKKMKNAWSELLPGLRFDVGKLPHTSLRYVGLDAKPESRKLLSVPIQTTPNPAFEEVRVEGSADEDSTIAEMLPNLQLSLGHAPEDDEVHAFLNACKGSRAMPGIDGNIMDMQTYRSFQLTSMRNRGLINVTKGVEDPVTIMLIDEGLGNSFRLVEKLSEKINALVDKHPDLADAKKIRPEYADLNEAETICAVTERVRKTRVDLINNMPFKKPFEFLDRFRQMAHIRVERPTKLTYHNYASEVERLTRAVRSNKRPLTSTGPPPISSASVRHATIAAMIKNNRAAAKLPRARK